MKACSFFGHRNTKETNELYEIIKKTVILLITEREVTTFLFGSNSSFDNLCWKVVTDLKRQYPFIKLVYVRSHYPYNNDWFINSILEDYDETTMSKRVENAGKASYVERNYEMIDASDFCVFYYYENYKPPIKKYSTHALSHYQPKSGTKLAYEYAKQKNVNTINLYNFKNSKG